MNQMMAAAAGATSTVLGQEVEISTPEVRDLASAGRRRGDRRGRRPRHARRARARRRAVRARPARAPRVRREMTRALDDRAASDFAAAALGGADGGDGAGEDSPGTILRGVALRVSAEIGRTEMPLADAVGVPPGAVLELDRAADDPIDLLVNGRRFATGGSSSSTASGASASRRSSRTSTGFPLPA
jgi:flagellar motor switch protein FliN/FliY